MKWKFWEEEGKRKKAAAGGAAVLAVIVIAGAAVFSSGRAEKTETGAESVSEEAVGLVVETGLAAAAETGLAAEPVVVPTEPVSQIPELEEDQLALLEGLTEALKARDYETAGAALLDNEQKLEYLFYQVMEGEQYLYRDGELMEELEGEGLVLKKPMSAFCGEFRGGAPEGEGVAIQGIMLDGLRYDYSDGTWTDGRMNGTGTVGYHYYEGTEGEESQAVERTGTFANDLMNGTFTYRTTSADGEVTVWEMEAEEGKTKLDERWSHDKEKQCYYLAANENGSHTYVLPEDATEETRWRNMLWWYE